MIRDANEPDPTPLAVDRIRRLLMVDDNRLDNLFHELLIKRTGLTDEIVCVESGEEAIEWLARPGNDADVVLVDINMGTLSGFEFVEVYMRSFAATGPIPTILIMSASNYAEDVDRARSLDGVVGFIEKPLHQDNIRYLVGLCAKPENMVMAADSSAS